MQSLSQEMLLMVMAPAWLSLAWFIIGLLLGMRVPKERQSRPNRVSPAARSRSGSLELYVGNLAAGAQEDSLRKMFERFGRVESVRLIANRSDGGSKIFAFVTMADAGAAEEAIRDLNGKDVNGRRLVVNEARSPRRRGRR
jgi:RNA recognition motif-containing protein